LEIAIVTATDQMSASASMPTLAYFAEAHVGHLPEFREVLGSNICTAASSTTSVTSSARATMKPAGIARPSAEIM
jgi:hypothetical protein